MEPTSLVLAVVGTLELCVKSGKTLQRFCREWRSIHADVEEIALILEGVWMKTEVQLNLLESLSTTDCLEPALWAHYLEAVKLLEKRISGAVSRQETINARMLSLSRSRIPFDARIVFLKRDLQQVVTDLEDWQRRFDPSWYLITLISRPAVDRELQAQLTTPETPAVRLSRMREVIHGVSSSKSLDFTTKESIFKDSCVLQSQRQRILHTNTFISHYSSDGRQVVLDRTNYPRKASALASKGQVRDLARLLRNVDPLAFGLLKCEGVIEVSDDNETQYEFLFEVPPGLHNLRTVRSLLSEEPQCSLTKRVQLAKQLAQSVMFVHTLGFVHKSIRPETILVCSQDSEDIGPSFLVGFERIRRAEAQTDFLGDLEWERNLYRHPVRQGLWAEEAFTMQHDIYSLGVCLLEIGLWRSFIRTKDGYTTPWEDMQIDGAIACKDSRKGGFAIKHRLVAMAKSRLPCLVGDRYTNLVVACLCCLDTGDENTFNAEGSDLRDSDGIIVGVRFIERVLLRIEELFI